MNFGKILDLISKNNVDPEKVFLLVDKINTVSGDILGDILLEEADGRFVIIEDYLPELQAEGVL